ncbi:MAG: NAD-dependent epimerase/dehydratase family protein [Vampirovibrionales bacterium]|nr:NAD-dependent epimerase/dehydratase family protein [Vampirovibrionales bacterium]
MRSLLAQPSQQNDSLSSDSSAYDWQHPLVQADLSTIAAQQLPWQTLANKTILITGASGLWGRYLIYSLLWLNDNMGLNCSVLANVRNLERASTLFNPVQNRPDLTLITHDFATLAAFDAGQPAQIIIHAASQAGPAYYGIDPVGTAMANSAGLAQLLQWGQANGCEKFLFVSSSEVYGQLRPEQIPTDETQLGALDSASVRACYGESKRLGETLCVGWHQQFGLPCYIVRPFHTYGPGVNLTDGRVFADFIAAVMARQPLQIRGDGSPTRAFCYIADAVAGLWTVLLKGTPATPYNIGAPVETSILQLAQTLAHQVFADRNLEILTEKTPQQVSGQYLNSPVSRNVPQVGKLQALGWQPWTSLAAGFERTISILERSIAF